MNRRAVTLLLLQFVGSVFNLGSSYYDGATTDFIDERPSGTPAITRC